jgi:hypothetical protein
VPAAPIVTVRLSESANDAKRSISPPPPPPAKYNPPPPPPPTVIICTFVTPLRVKVPDEVKMWYLVEPTVTTSLPPVAGAGVSSPVGIQAEVYEEEREYFPKRRVPIFSY